MGIDLRLATLEDMDEIMSLERLGFAVGVQENADVYKKRINVFPNGCLIAELEKKIIGCLFSEIWEDQKNISKKNFILGHDINLTHDINGSTLYISSMTINISFRGRGFGYELFTKSIKLLCSSYPKLDACVLLVNETWINAKSIYQKAGFSEVLVINNFFHPFDIKPQNGIVMIKNLTK